MLQRLDSYLEPCLFKKKSIYYLSIKIHNLIGKKINIIKSWTSRVGFNFKQVKKLMMGFRKKTWLLLRDVRSLYLSMSMPGPFPLFRT